MHSGGSSFVVRNIIAIPLSSSLSLFRSDGSGSDHPTRNRSADASKRTARRVRAEENSPLTKQDKVLVFRDVGTQKQYMPALCFLRTECYFFYGRNEPPSFFLFWSELDVGRRAPACESG